MIDHTQQMIPETYLWHGFRPDDSDNQVRTKEIHLEAVISLRGNDSPIRVQGSPTAQRFCVFIALENLHRERFPGRHVEKVLPAIRSVDLRTPRGKRRNGPRIKAGRVFY